MCDTEAARAARTQSRPRAGGQRLLRPRERRPRRQRRAGGGPPPPVAESGAVAINCSPPRRRRQDTRARRTIRACVRDFAVVIEGGPGDRRDAARIRAAGAPATVQVNTGTRLSSRRAHVGERPDELDSPAGPCGPDRKRRQNLSAGVFDLGEAVKVVVASVTEARTTSTRSTPTCSGRRLVLLNKDRPRTDSRSLRAGARVSFVNPVETLAVPRRRRRRSTPGSSGEVPRHGAASRRDGIARHHLMDAAALAAESTAGHRSARRGRPASPSSPRRCPGAPAGSSTSRGPRADDGAARSRRPAPRRDCGAAEMRYRSLVEQILQ